MRRQWNAKTAALLASGPSLNQGDVDYLRHRCHVMAVNDCYRIAPWADALYAADEEWWHLHKGAEGFAGEKWTQSSAAATRYDLRHIEGVDRPGLSLDPHRIHFGLNSGFQALNLAVLLGAYRILLLGYDMRLAASGKRHWFGDHPGAMNKDSDYRAFAARFDAILPQLDAVGVEVINCTPGTALRCFPQAELRTVI